jgi:hypothetical protein
MLQLFFHPACLSTVSVSYWRGAALAVGMFELEAPEFHEECVQVGSRTTSGAAFFNPTYGSATGSVADSDPVPL